LWIYWAVIAGGGEGGAATSGGDTVMGAAKISIFRTR
jgi:hypothetical protein